MLKQMLSQNWLKVLSLVSMLVSLLLIALAWIVPSSFIKAGLILSITVTLTAAKMEYISSNSRE